MVRGIAAARLHVLQKHVCQGLSPGRCAAVTFPSMLGARCSGCCSTHGYSRGLSTCAAAALGDAARPLDAAELTARIVGDLSGAVAVQLMYIGDRLGLFKILAAAPEGMTASDLASKAGCHLRYVETWCQACVAHSFMETEPQASGVDLADGRRRYWMTEAQREVLAAEGGRFFQCGAAQLLSASAQATPAMMDRGFKCLAGGGISYGEMGRDAREGISRMNGVALRDLLPGWLAKIPAVTRALARPGACILDVGCGYGASTLALAQAFPNVTVVGLDPDPDSIAAARDALARQPLPNARFEMKGLEAMAEVAGGRFDVILAYDCIHDLIDPLGSLKVCCDHLRRSSDGDGALVWFEPHGSDDPYENRDLLGARMVAGIALNCVTTSMAMGGAGLGAHGCTPAKAEALARRAGFTSFQREQSLKGIRYRNNVYVLQ